MNNGDRPVGWQALRRGWNTNRVSAFPEGSQSGELCTGTSSDAGRKSLLMKTTCLDPLKHSPHRATSADPCEPHSPLQGENSAGTYKSYTSSQRTSGAQPLRATAPLCATNSSSQPSHIQTSSAVTTLIPQNKAGFSSITISSRKVSRSASLPGSPHSSESPSPPPANQPMDPNSRQFTVKRQATIVKVMEQRTMSNPAPSTESAGTPPANQALDTVVRRRKATIIKVTERRESFSPATAGAGTRHPEYRHSYTDGAYKGNSTWNQGNHSQHNAAASYPRPNAALTPNKPSSDAEQNDGTVHRSTLSLLLNSPPAIAAPAPSAVPLRPAGRRSERPHRPQSCYGNVCEPSKEYGAQPAARKWSFGHPHESGGGPVSCDGGFISRPTAAGEAGQLVARAHQPNGCKAERAPPETAERRMSPSLTLIKAPGRFVCPTLSLFLSARSLLLPLISIFQRTAASKYTLPLCGSCVLD